MRHIRIYIIIIIIIITIIIIIIIIKPRIKLNHNKYTCTVVISPHRSQLTMEQH